ncbi:MAG: segregation and condensation protein A [Planctomycetota bacterium]|jgi:segregation and condensation protein A
MDASSTDRPGTSPAREEYLVRLDRFQGPLDLLLFLIRRAEVDIHDIPIHEITEQYLAHLGDLHRIDMETAGEFLVLAATLVEIKAKSLAPRPETEAEGETDEFAGLAEADPRLDLVRQLLDYQRFRDASEALDSLRNEHARRHLVRARPESRTSEEEIEEDEEAPLELDDAHVIDLLEAFERIISAVDLDRLGDHRVEMDETPQALHQADLADRLERAPHHRLPLAEAIFARTRMEMIGLFLAVLELARGQRIAIRQEDGEGGVELEWVAEVRSDSEGDTGPASSPSVEEAADDR